MPEQRYHVGENWARQEPVLAACFRRWQNAADFLINSMQEHADNDDAFARAGIMLDGGPDYATEEEWLNSDDYPNMRAVVDSILRDDPPVEGSDYAAEVADSDDWHVVFWLKKVVCDHETARDDDE